MRLGVAQLWWEGVGVCKFLGQPGDYIIWQRHFVCALVNGCTCVTRLGPRAWARPYVWQDFSKYPIQHFFPMPHCSDTASVAHCPTGLVYIPVPWVVVVRLRCCLATRFFPLRHFFFGESLISHILTNFCILGYQGIPQPSTAMNGQRLVYPVPH